MGGGGPQTCTSLSRYVIFLKAPLRGFSSFFFFFFFSAVVVVGAQAVAEHPAGASPLPSPPLLYLRGRALWPSGSDAAWASRLPSHPAADTRVKAERRGGPPQTHTGEGDSVGGGEYMARSQPIVYSLSLALAHSLSYSVNHSVTTLRALPPTLLTCSSLSVSPAQIFTLLFFLFLSYLCHTSDCFLRHLLKRLANRFLPSSVQAGQRYINFALNSETV